MSNRMVPSDEKDRKLLVEAAQEMATQEKERKAVEKDWGEMVNEQKALPPGKGWKH